MNFESFPKPYCFLQNNSTENLSFHLATVSNEINQKYAMGGVTVEDITDSRACSGIPLSTFTENYYIYFFDKNDTRNVNGYGRDVVTVQSKDENFRIDYFLSSCQNIFIKTIGEQLRDYRNNNSKRQREV